MPTEYDYIDKIGNTYETASDPSAQKIKNYYHKKQVQTVNDLLKKMKFKNFKRIIDLGCSTGGWFNHYKSLSFKDIIGIDISDERAYEAKQRGYHETYVCNAYDLPFDNESEPCIISNGVLVHVLQDSDKLKIFNEVKRVLKKNGVFIFSIANASGYGFKTDTTKDYCRWNKPKTISALVEKSGLNIDFILPSYYLVPKLGKQKKLVSFSTKTVFPFTDFLLKKFNNLTYAKVIYFGVRKLDEKK